jgi:hypothetical protein
MGKLRDSEDNYLILRWFQSFLKNRMQRVKIGNNKSDWVNINGSVAQSILCRPELFIHMVVDLQTEVPNVKFVEDTTSIEAMQKDSNSHMNSSVKSVL